MFFYQRTETNSKQTMRFHPRKIICLRRFKILQLFLIVSVEYFVTYFYIFTYFIAFFPVFTILTYLC